MIEKSKLKELSKRIDEVLYYLWDPVGVSDYAYTRGEYSSYVPSILKAVLSEDIETVIQKLSEIERIYMECIPNPKHNKEIASRLLADKNSVEEGIY